MKTSQNNPPIIFFDGVCNLCNQSVQFIIRNDRKELFKFSSLQSEYAQQTLESYPLDLKKINSIVLLEDTKTFTESTAALKIAYHLNFPFNLLYWFIYTPKRLRNFVYRWIAKNRYQWFGRKNECWVPTAEIRKRFIE